MNSTNFKQSVQRFALGLGLLCLPALAPAVSLGFSCISFNHLHSCAAGESQLLMTLEQVDETAVFTFSNVGDADSFIAQVYFDDASGSLLNLASIGYSSTGTVNFTEGARPANLPAGNSIDFKADYSFGAVAPSPKNGVNNAVSDNEWLALTFNLAVSYDDLLNAMINGELRVGLHVQGYKRGYSEAFVNTPPMPAVPVPAAAWLLGSGLMGLTLVARRRNTAAH